jgi:hypothetical protein
MANEPIAQMAAGQYGMSEGPFTGILQQGLLPQVSQQPTQEYGGGNKYGVIAMMGDSMLKGLQKGRLMRYMVNEAQTAQKYQAGLSEFDMKRQEIESDKELSDSDKQSRLNELSKYRLQYINQHFQQGMADTQGGQDQGKKASKQQGGAAGAAGELQGGGKSKGKKGDQQPQSIGQQIGGFMSNVMNRMAGPGLPATRPADLDWVSGRIRDIDKMPTESKNAAEDAFKDMMIRTQGQVGGDRQVSSRDLINSGLFENVREKYRKAYGDRGMDMLNTKLQAVGTPKEQMEEALMQQDYDMLKVQDTVRREQNQVSVTPQPTELPPDLYGAGLPRPKGAQGNAPQAQGQQGPGQAAGTASTVSPTQGGSRPGPPGQPPAAQAPPLPKESQNQNKYIDSDFDQFIQPTLRPIVSPRINKQPSTVYAYRDLPNGKQEVIGLKDWDGLITDVGNQPVKVGDAKASGWKFSGVMPRIQADPYHPSKWTYQGKVYQTIFNPETKKYDLAIGPDQRPMLIGEAPGAKEMIKFGQQQLQGIMTRRDNNERKLEADKQKLNNRLADLYNPTKTQDITNANRPIWDDKDKGKQAQAQQIAKDMNMKDPKQVTNRDVFIWKTLQDIANVDRQIQKNKTDADTYIRQLGMDTQNSLFMQLADRNQEERDIQAAQDSQGIVP